MAIEKVKLAKFKKLHNINFSFIARTSIFFQGLTLATWAGLVQRFSFNIEDYPEMINGGLFWFKDLSMTDPYFILPLINVFFIYLNIYVKLFNLEY
jgi:hypothetical protein